MRLMGYYIFCASLLTSVLVSVPVQAFRLSFRPLEHIRYRAGACEDSLERLTYALLKEKVYTGCLTAALASLDQKESALSRRFGRRYNLKNRQFQLNYDPLLKQVLRREILERLGQKDSVSTFLDQPLIPTSDSEENFRSSISRFCRHKKMIQESYSQERVKRIIYGLKALDIHHLFEEFRRTLLVAKALEYKNPQMMKEIKRLRERFLIVINQMIILKKSLAGKKLQEGEDVEDTMRKIVLRTEWINIYADLKSQVLMSEGCQEDSRGCKEGFQDMDQLASIIQSFDDLKNVCWVARGGRQSNG